MPSPESPRLTVKWLLLPNGISADGTELLFSVFAAPALTGDDTGGPPALADFPDLLDWPAVVSRVDLGVEFAGLGQQVPARLLSGPPSTQVWQALFGPSTTVVPFAGEDLTERPVMTFSAGSVLETLRGSYAQLVVEAVDDLPLIAPVAQATAGTGRPFAAFAEALQNPTLQSLMGGAELRSATLRSLAGNAVTRADSPTGMTELMAGGDRPADEVVRAVAFHVAQVPASEPVTDPDRVAAERAALHDSVDFHKIVSSLNEHPALLRHLGLVFDVAVPRSAVGNRTSGAARLMPAWTATFANPAAQKTDRPLWVAWQLDPQGPMPFTTGTGGVPGVLDLGTRSPFAVEPMALDSAVLQAVAMLKSLPQGGARGAPPAVRSGGLTITHADRGQEVHADLAAATDHGRGATPETALGAADVVRGYRLDVLDEGGPGWRSLHARRVSYVKEGTPLVDPVLDEGSHHPTATGPPVPAGADPDTGAPLYVHESFVRWDGWSLSASRPGRSLGVDPNGPDPDHPDTMPQRTTNDPLTQAGLRIETRVQPRSLPRLRFGHTYRLRMRTVDLAGNGLDPAAADALWQRPSITLPGGHVVTPDALASPPVRFTRFEPVPPPVIIQATPERESVHRLVLRSGTDDPALGVAAAECRLYAPKGSVELAERYGRFDDAIGSADAARVQASYDLAARESGVLPAAGSDELPYLPDPLAIGVRIADVPGIVAGETPALEWRGASWDRPRPIALRVLVSEEHFQPPVFDQDALTVTIRLDPGMRAVLRISSLIPEGTPFGLFDWLTEGTGEEISQTTVSQVRRAIDDSRHVMFTPWEQIEILHAVQQPLGVPDLQPQPDVERNPGETEYRPNVTLVPEPLTTGVLQLDAIWTDVVDDPAVRFEPPADGAPVPWLRTVSTTIGNTPLAEPELVGGVLPIFQPTDLYTLRNSSMPPLQFSDTRARTITLTATAVSRFAAEFPELAGRPDRFVRAGAPARAVVQSTARPPAPVVVDVVPIVSTGPFSLDRGQLVREGGWVRIWLERPWFVSGTDEQLGVVVLDRNPSGPADQLYDYASLIGRDAAHEGLFMPGLRISHVLNPIGTVNGVVLPEPLARFGNGEPVHLALFEPQFDFDSQRWFVDMQLDTQGTYFPMVRLAVVRYQPHSVATPAGAALSAHHYFVSPVVLLDPVPLFPDRRLVVQKVIKPSHSLLRFELSGTPYTATSALDGTRDATKKALARVTVRTQHQLPADLAGGGEHWLNGPPVDLKRDSVDKPWRLQLEDSDLRLFLDDGERVLVVEEDRLPYDPTDVAPGQTAARTVFAAVVEGPFMPPPSPLVD
jgi:hypothetical protein